MIRLLPIASGLLIALAVPGQQLIPAEKGYVPAVSKYSYEAMLVADFDGDNDLDWLLGSSLLLNQGQGVFDPAGWSQFASANVMASAGADIDGDGDFAVHDQSNFICDTVTGTDTDTFIIPNSPSLRDQSIYFQGLIFDMEGRTHLTNLLGDTIR